MGGKSWEAVKLFPGYYEYFAEILTAPGKFNHICGKFEYLHGK